MKILLTLCLFLGLSSAFASTRQEAANLYSQRGNDRTMALKAAAIYKALASAEGNTLEKSRLIISQSEAIYYAGTTETNNKKKIALHKEGYKVAESAFGLLASSAGVAKKEEYKTDLSRLYYFYGANLGKWGEARGVIASLSKWPRLKKVVSYIRGLDVSVEDFGANRVLGRAFMKVPFESNQQSYEYLKEAYDNTLVTVEDITLSRNATTVLYFLDILKQLNKTSEFCDVYMNFTEFSELEDDAAVKAYNSKLIPETKREMKSFQDNESWLNFFDRNC